MIHFVSDVKEKSTVKQVYTEFYHQLVDAISDPHTSQALTAQLHSTTLIPQEKIAQLSFGQTSGREFLKVLGVEEEPHLLTVLMEKMAGVKQLQTLTELMTARLSELQQGKPTACSVCVCACVCACRRACLHVCVRVCMRVCVHACVYIYIYIYIYIHVCVCVCKHTYSESVLITCVCIYWYRS